MPYATTPTVVDDGLTIIFTRFPANLREQRGEAVIIIHCPAVKRMIVALGALDAHTHKNLSGVFGQFQRIPFHLIKVAGRIAEGSTAGAKEFLHNLVHRLVLLKLFT